MNRRVVYWVIAVGILFTSVCVPVFARKAKEGKAGSEMKLVSVDLPNNKITVSNPNGEEVNTLSVMQVTKVTLDGQPAKLSDLRKGMRVMLSVSQGGKVADKIDATSPTVAKKGN
ncbi:MAG TPA: hypothetical protein VMP11_06440 [Verrucomicrobiae bacterium]|nr:hypothetical protein [Verrucomicrobiae bacterium]